MNTPVKSESKWDKPQVVDRITMAFPAGIVGKFLPLWEEIPEDFRRESGDARPWCDLCNRWFACGLKGDEIAVKDGIDAKAAFGHLKTCMGSFDPKHEHKISGVAWLMSKWFDRA